MSQIYRTGGLGALQDEYEKASIELFALLESMTEQEYLQERPQERESINSIQKIMTHVVGSAYSYANKIRTAIGVEATVSFPDSDLPLAEVIPALHQALDYMAASFEGKWTMSEDDLDSITMPTPWNVVYSIDQMMEHAIVHILRHRRQIERILSSQ
jgi:uncharacterized damage-inducible protein DinB